MSDTVYELIDVLEDAVKDKSHAYEIDIKANGYSFTTTVERTEYLETVMKCVAQQLNNIMEVE